MITFLTSSFIKYQKMEEYTPSPVDSANGFVDNLRTYWKDNSRFLLIPSDPDDAELVDHVARETSDAFRLSDFSISEFRYVDRRVIKDYAQAAGIDEKDAAVKCVGELVKWADVVYLSGGHAPTENAFIKECDLKGALGLDSHGHEFDGIFLGLSAGSVNSAGEVYLLPELSGESLTDKEEKFTSGLGLTRIRMAPHIQYLDKLKLDGRDLVNDIFAEEAYDRQLFLVPDGSYFMIKDGVTELFGDAEIMEKGRRFRIAPGIVYSDLDIIKNLDNSDRSHAADIMASLLYNNYEAVLAFDPKSLCMRIFHISAFLLDNGFVPLNYSSFDKFMEDFDIRLVVEEEKQAALEDFDVSVIMDEVDRYGEYVRTVHIDTSDGVMVEKVAARALNGEKKELLCTMVNIAGVVNRDWMTDVFSRSGFLTEAKKFIKYEMGGADYSLVYANVQGFKAINDLFSSYSGDMVIFQTRDEIRRNMDPVFLARLEADHYVFVVKDSHLTDENIKNLCYQVYREGSKEYQFQIRCGICHITDDGTEADHLIARAKLAESMISAGRGIPYAVYDEKMRNEYIEQRVFVSELDQALEQGEFKTYYQPVVDIKTRQIVSAEALVRWQHHSQGMISPGKFVPVFEQRGLITKVDYFMIENVLKFNSKRRSMGLKFVPCAVNLSRVDFYDSVLISDIMDRLKGSENIQQMLKLEVTESAYAELESNALEFLTEAENMGMSVLLDDFGSGMSSMSTLESFNFDVVKLDMGFVRKIGKSAKAEAIIRSIIELSHAVGAKVVAEGVEEDAQLTFLEAAGCDMIQGYYFYKPLPEEEFWKLLEE